MHNLSKREKEILKITANGYTAKETATYMGISEQTVKNHLQKTYIKLRVRNRYEAFMEMGWLTPPKITQLRSPND